MFGNFNINHDSGKIQYDLKADFPLLGEFYLTRQHVEQCLRHFDATKKDAEAYNTNKMDGIRLRDVDFVDLNYLIEKFQAVVDDLHEIGAKIQEKSGKELPKPLHLKDKKSAEEPVQK